MQSTLQEKHHALERQVNSLAQSLTRNSQSLARIASTVSLHSTFFEARLKELDSRTLLASDGSLLRPPDVGMQGQFAAIEQRIFALEQAAQSFQHQSEHVRPVPINEEAIAQSLQSLPAFPSGRAAPMAPPTAPPMMMGKSLATEVLLPVGDSPRPDPSPRPRPMNPVDNSLELRSVTPYGPLESGSFAIWDIHATGSLATGRSACGSPLSTQPLGSPKTFGSLTMETIASQVEQLSQEHRELAAIVSRVEKRPQDGVKNDGSVVKEANRQLEKEMSRDMSRADTVLTGMESAVSSKSTAIPESKSDVNVVRFNTLSLEEPPGARRSQRAGRSKASKRRTAGTIGSAEIRGAVVNHMSTHSHKLAHLHRVESTVWEMALFIGTDVMSDYRSAFLTMACIISIMLEATFVWIVSILSGFWDKAPPGDVLDVLSHWRYTVAHDSSHVSHFTQESMVSRVCRQDSNLGVHEMKVWLVREMHQFLRPVLGGWGCVGPVLVTACVVVWSLQCTSEIVSTFSFMSALMNLTSTSKTRLRRANNRGTQSSLIIEDDDDDESPLELQTISVCRKISLFLLSCFRLSLGISLLHFGSVWLAETNSLQELLLNAVSLAFVFDIDEICFELMSPLTVRAIANTLSPLRKTCHLFGLRRLEEFVPKCAVVIFACYLLFDRIVPDVGDLQAQWDALCGGQKDFVVAVNDATKVLYAAPTRKFGEDDGSVSRSGASRQERLVKSLVNSPVLFRDANFVSMDNVADLSLRSDMPIQEFVVDRFAETCADTLERSPSFVLDALQHYNNNPTATTCDGLKENCFDVDQDFLRLNCPVTCGATSPYSGQILIDAEYGIDRYMCHETDAYRSSLTKIPCTDLTVKELRALPGWSRTWHQFVEIQSRFEATRSCYQKVANIFLSEGCKGLSHDPTAFACISIAQTDVEFMFCSGQGSYPNLAVFCPVACRCELHHSPSCTPACH